MNPDDSSIATRMASHLRDWADGHPSLLKVVRKPALAIVHRFGRQEARCADHILGRLAAASAEDPCIRIDEFDGSFYVDVRSSLFRRVVISGNYEPELSALCASLVEPERDIIDIGANVGFHAVMFGQRLRSGRCLSIEPTPQAFARLQRNIERNAVKDRVILFHGAVAKSDGLVKIHVVPGQEEFSSIGELIHPSVADVAHETQTINAVTVDSLVLAHKLNPALIKIDVEGAEHEVLQGAQHTLKVHKPTIVAELSDPLLRANGSSAPGLVHWLEHLGYQVRDPIRTKATPGSREFGNIVCVAR